MGAETRSMNSRHERLVAAYDKAIEDVRQAERMLAEYGGMGNEASLANARYRLEDAETRLRISEGRA